jgi:hypothetical protein
MVGYNVSDELNTESGWSFTINCKTKEKRNSINTSIQIRGITILWKISKILCVKFNSMTQNSDPYENAVAEEYGILKQNFYIDKPQ